MLGEEFLREVIIARIATFQHLDKWASAGSIKQLFDPNEFHIAGNLLKIFELGDILKCALSGKILPRAAKINPELGQPNIIPFPMSSPLNPSDLETRNVTHSQCQHVLTINRARRDSVVAT